MRRTMTALTLAGALALTACGSDEPEVTEPAAADDDVTAATISFGTLDANGDSFLDDDEIAEFVDRNGFEAWDADADSEIDRDEIVGNSFELFDADGNGMLTEAEWKDGVTRWVPTGTQVVPLADYDRDGDSELDADEFSEAYDADALGEEWADVPLDQAEFRTKYFGLYDTDDDGKVTETEFENGLDYVGTPVSA